MDSFVQRITDALTYPTEDPRTTIVVVLVVAVLGMLVAVALVAAATPGRSTDTTDASAE